MKTVVTGAGGHIGGALVRLLLEENHEVKAVIRTDKRALEGLDVEIVKADVLDRDSLVKAFKDAKYVFHLAARISISGNQGGLVYDTNVIGPKNVVYACENTGIKRLVHFSSVHAHCQSPLDEPLDEKRPYVISRSPAYDFSKGAGEREILKGVSNGLDAVVVNPTGVIGPFDFKPSRMGEVFLDLQHKKLAGLIKGGFDWVDVRDVAKGALSALNNGRAGHKYLLSGHWRSMEELGQMTYETTNVKPPGFVSPMWLARLGAPFVENFSKLANRRPLYTGESLCALRSNRNISYDKAAKELGYKPRPTKETVEDVYEWFDKAGKLKSNG